MSLLDIAAASASLPDFNLPPRPQAFPPSFVPQIQTARDAVDTDPAMMPSISTEHVRSFFGFDLASVEELDAVELKPIADLAQQKAMEASSELKPSNPKDMIGSDKIPLHLWPTTASILGALALLDGASKYGRQNFRAVGVRASIYVDAAMRHLNAWFEGEDNDPDSGIPHLGHALACVAILIEATAAGNMTDDRAYKTNYREWINKLTPLVKQIKKNHESKDPKHYSIKDSTNV